MPCIICDKRRGDNLRLLKIRIYARRREMGIEIYFTGELKAGIEKLVCTAAFRGIEEIRLRINRPVRIVGGGRMYYLTSDGQLCSRSQDAIVCHREELARCLELMSDYSLYAFNEEIKNGFITLPGGHRVGICGRAVCDKGEVKHIKNISSMNFRLAGEKVGIADELSKHLLRGGGLYSTLILSPAGCGKTTLLRDIVRCVSNQGITVSVIDERSEIAACYKGVPQNDVGDCTDVMDMVPKSRGIMMVLRAMSPRVIAVDEINQSEDLGAIRSARSCGAALLCTMHSDENCFDQQIMSEGIFERYIQLGNNRSCRVYDAGMGLLYECSLQNGEEVL